MTGRRGGPSGPPPYRTANPARGLNSFLSVVRVAFTHAAAGRPSRIGWPLIVIGFVSIPLGLEVFRRGERYAKQHGKLKRSGASRLLWWPTPDITTRVDPGIVACSSWATIFS